MFYFLEFIEKYIYNTIGFLELQEVHKQFKVEVDGLKMKLQAVDENMTQKLVNSQSDQISQDKQQFSANRMRKLEELNLNLKTENQKLKATWDQISQFSSDMMETRELNLNLKAENQKLKAHCDQISQDKLYAGLVTMQEKQDSSEEVFRYVREKSF